MRLNYLQGCCKVVNLTKLSRVKIDGKSRLPNGSLVTVSKRRFFFVKLLTMQQPWNYLQNLLTVSCL
jgi:hypothetical protein